MVIRNRRIEQKVEASNGKEESERHKKDLTRGAHIS